MMIDWDNNVGGALAISVGFILGVTVGGSWYWAPLVFVSALAGACLYDVTKAVIIRKRTAS